jgi:Na+-translocating ferredoxin:NAD+ oxidoreductase RnfG subunit
MNKTSPIVILLVIIAVIALGIFGVIYLQQAVPDTIKSNSGGSENTKAATRCVEVVKASLRDAVKAKFSNQRVTTLGKSRYQITGNVDAPNASGIIVRGNYNCIFNFNTKSFDLLSLEGDDVWKPLKK